MGQSHESTFVHDLWCLWLDVKGLVGCLPSGVFDCGDATSGELRQRLDLDQNGIMFNMIILGWCGKPDGKWAWHSVVFL